MRVLQFTSKLQNGAGIAAVRLHECFLREGIDSKFYFGTGASRGGDTQQAFRKQGFVGDSVNRVLAGLRSRTQAGEGYVNSPRWWVNAFM